jgi:3D (Asp-Asp-Asp) domain-containing protein
MSAVVPPPMVPESVPPELPLGGSTLTLRATLYMIALESDYPEGRDAAFRTRDGEVLHQTSKEFLAVATLQGTAQLNDGRVLMIDGRRKGAPRWKVSPHGYAVGFSGCKLVPFRSVAVDRRVVPLGSELTIDETRGMKLPDGTVHDGTWYALDTGGRIRNNRVDLFVGVGKGPLSIPMEHGIGHLRPLKVRLGTHKRSCPAA